MAGKMRTNKSTKNTTRTRNKPGMRNTAWFAMREFWAVILTVISVITIIALFISDQGILSNGWALALRQIFGIGAYIVAFAWLAGSITLLAWDHIEPRLHPRWQLIAGCSIVFLALLGFVHVSSGTDPFNLAQVGRAGGFIGWLWWQALVPWFGRGLSLVLLAIIVLLGLYLTLGIPWASILKHLRMIWFSIHSWVRQIPAALHTVFPPSPAVPVVPIRTIQSSTVPRTVKLDRLPSAVEGKLIPNRPTPEAKRARQPNPDPIKLVTLGGLPSLAILTPDQEIGGDDSDARERAETIEKTLRAFGIPASVIEWHRGPAVTQFGIEPGYTERQDRDGNTLQFKVRVSKIIALSNDLALALAAAPIRIEAPVPGRPVVGIEVPNSTKSLVGLRGVLESEEFQKSKGRLRIALGRDVSGKAVVADLATMPHLLVSGATGSGKSACLNAIIASLLFYNQPDQVKLLLVDPKRVELTNYNGIPHLIAPVVVDTSKVIIALRWVIREMERRYTIFAQLGVRDIGSYDKLVKSKQLEALPMIVVVIDELADLMQSATDDVEQTLCRIAQMARATGIHLVVAVQRPSVDVVTGLIKANFPARISFLVTSQVDSRVILDAPGAEKLLGRGDMLYMASDSPKLERIQGCYAFDKELEALVSFWRQAKLSEHQEAEEEIPPWEGTSVEEVEADDALLEQAATLVREHNQASASFLQRQMRIGYPRAARLIDQLQEMGVVGPPETGGRTRLVITEAPPNTDTAKVEADSPPQLPDAEAEA
jgi:S-DNA-T family DNA segregation ATPase FtsK/SpoIIIE